MGEKEHHSVMNVFGPNIPVFPYSSFSISLRGEANGQIDH